MRLIKSDERGAALPLAAITLALIASLLISLATMSATEPIIASNQLLSAQALALAEAGIERALWAVQRPDAADGLPSPLPNAVPAPYDGTRLIALAVDGIASGGFRLTVSPGAAPNERQVVSVGWAPTDDPRDFRPKGQRRITATLWRVRVPAEIAPCALCALLFVCVGAQPVPITRAGESTQATTTEVTREDIFIPHVSTVPANAGQSVGLSIRHVIRTNPRSTRGAVLFTNDGFNSTLAMFDLDYKS